MQVELQMQARLMLLTVGEIPQLVQLLHLLPIALQVVLLPPLRILHLLLPWPPNGQLPIAPDREGRHGHED